MIVVESSGNLILTFANIIAILRADNSSRYQQSSQTGARPACHSLRPQTNVYVKYILLLNTSLSAADDVLLIKCLKQPRKVISQYQIYHNINLIEFLGVKFHSEI